MASPAPKGYANEKEYLNELLTRRQVHEEVRERILPGYHQQHVAPIEGWLSMPASERAWERGKMWFGRELTWPPRTPWWWDRLRTWVPEAVSSLVEWIRERLGSDEEELAEPAAGGGAS